MPAELPYPVSDRKLHERRERVFLVFAGLFLGSMTMLNILGITRFIKLGQMTVDTEHGPWTIAFAVAVGVLPYPLTFLCTDFISELYGRRRANFVVWIGLLLNIWVVFILWLGGVLPGFEALAADGQPVRDAAGRAPVFYEVRSLAFGAVAASMCAYMAAQFCDVYVFHFWKRLTRGRHLWLRNNGSTLISQLVDTVAVILITHFYAHALPLNDLAPVWVQLLVFIATGYAFKAAVALLDTPIFYLGVHYLSRYLQIDQRRARTPASRRRPPRGVIPTVSPLPKRRPKWSPVARKHLPSRRLRRCHPACHPMSPRRHPPSFSSHEPLRRRSEPALPAAASNTYTNLSIIRIGALPCPS